MEGNSKPKVKIAASRDDRVEGYSIPQLFLIYGIASAITKNRKDSMPFRFLLM